MNDHDPILESTLEEALGGKTPPDLIAATLAKLQAPPAAPESAAGPQSVAGPRPLWRAWGGKLATAAAVVVTIGVLTLAAIPFVTTNNRTVDTPQHESIADVTTGTEDSAGGEYEFHAFSPTLEPKDRPLGGVNMNLPGDRPPQAPPTEPPPPPPAPPVPDPQTPRTPEDMIFKDYGSNPFVHTEDDAKSTFALEHDTGSYTMTRAYLRDGNLPPKAAIRVEEFVNYFDYGYVKPAMDPFNITFDAAPSRYGQDINNCYLLRVGVQAREVHPLRRKPAVLTLVIDVSGSMTGENRLGLVKRALTTLVNELVEGDKVAIIEFGSEAKLVLEHRDAGNKDRILSAIDGLHTNGTTNAEAGLRMAYDYAAKAYREGHTNRVILCSDGVANTGISDVNGLLEEIVNRRRDGILLSALGFGMSNMNDALMEQLGNKGSGRYAYIDSIDEAERMFRDNLTGALEVVGRDVKMQIKFNPQVVRSYRLIGYVNRDIKDSDFRNDAVGGGEIGSGHAATALYEIKLYEGASGKIGSATVRFKEDEQHDAKEISREVFTSDVAAEWQYADKGLRLAANAAEFAEILGEGFYAKYAELAPVIEDLERLRSEFGNTQVDELIELVKKAHELKE
jgi:Ca-activated chloride channel family protein